MSDKLLWDLRGWLDAVEAIVASHRLETGVYRRWNWQRPGAAPSAVRDLRVNEYGCADAANILYTLGRFPAAPVERAAWVAALQSLQKPSGLFEEATHHPIHTTAHCLAALELFDATAARPVTALHSYLAPNALESFLDGLDWRALPWQQSHQGAGLYVALVLTQAADLAWQDRYFTWLWREADPVSGFWRQGCVAPIPLGTLPRPTRFPHLAGSFHYLFNLEYARQPLRYPEAMVDSCLAMFAEDAFQLGVTIGFAEIDWVYCLTRAVRQSGHRFDESRQALRALAVRFRDFLQALDPATHDGMNDLHALFGTLCAWAELQSALPGELRTDRPLRLVLDRRPFI